MLRLLRPGARPVSQFGDRTDPLGAVAVRAAAGSPDAQRTFMAELGSPLLRTVRAVLGSAHPDVEDVLQDAMTAVHTALPGEEALVGRAQALRTLGRSSDERQVWEELLNRFPSSVYAARAQQRLVELEL